ncbi:MAG: gliding motility-associated C-terminal domain-containing protein, partial [Flavobacteriales bacterium]|nr:gliding motility-associated C-terminal domain-containing protein [Flavobacteriales bacterium]
AGTYIINITDANGCIQADTFAIAEPDDLISTISTSDYNSYGVSCFGGNDGNINLNIDQNTGTAPFTYSWSSGHTSLNLSNLQAGQYTVTITDDNGCDYTELTNITQPAQVAVTPVVSTNYNGADISCFGASDGAAIVTSIGGVQPYDISWSTSETTNSISSLSAGTYTVTITDENGCIESEDVELEDPPVLVLDLNVRDSLSYNVSCFGICDGWAQALPSGGTSISLTYTYSWSDGQTNALAENLCAGASYTVTVTDDNSCEISSTTIYFTQPPAFEADVTTTDYFGPSKPPLKVNFSDSTYLSTIHPMLFTWQWPDGGIELVSWDFGDPGMNISYSFTDIGENKVNLIVLNKTTACADTIDFVIDVQGLGDITNVFSPNGDGVNDVFAFENHGMDILSVMIFNRWGQKVFETDVSSAQWDGKNLKGNDELAGTYFYVLKAQGKDGYRYEEKGAVILIRE